jgi:hypothetical protein
MRGRGSVNTDEFIREVDEAVRQEQWLKLWKQYGSYVTAAVLALVIGSAAAVGWRAWQEKERLEDARRYAAAQQLLRDAKPAEAAEAFGALAEDARGGYRVLARLRAAEARAQAGDPAAATAALEQLAATDEADPVYRALGELLVAQRGFADGQPGALLAELEPLVGIDGPWRYSALELRALAQMQSGDTVAARQTLDDLLADPLTPPALGRRAAELLAFLGGPPAKEEPAAEAGPRPAASAAEEPAAEAGQQSAAPAAERTGAVPAQEGAVAGGD